MRRRRRAPRAPPRSRWSVAISMRSRRDERLRRTSLRVACQPSVPRRAAEAERRRQRRGLVRARGARGRAGRRPARRPIRAAAASRRAGEQALERGRVEVGPRLGQQRRRAGDDRGRGARSADARVARRAVLGLARVGGQQPDAGRDEIRLHEAVEREPARRERRDATARRPARSALAVLSDDERLSARRRAPASRRRPTASGTLDDRDGHVSSRPMPPPGSVSPKSTTALAPAFAAWDAA